MARLAKKESEWKGKLGFSSRSTKAEVRAKCKQTETANRSRVENMSEPVPSTSSYQRVVRVKVCQVLGVNRVGGRGYGPAAAIYWPKSILTQILTLAANNSGRLGTRRLR